MKKKVIGITGGIGCGKSAVMSLLEEKYQEDGIFVRAYVPESIYMNI